MYKVLLKPQAKKEFERLPEEYAARMKTAFEILQYEPRPFREFDVQKISGSEQDYRIRIGKYRFIYSIFQEEQAIVILKIDLRSETTYK